jgi:hypothetical protein
LFSLQKELGKLSIRAPNRPGALVSIREQRAPGVNDVSETESETGLD